MGRPSSTLAAARFQDRCVQPLGHPPCEYNQRYLGLNASTRVVDRIVVPTSMSTPRWLPAHRIRSSRRVTAPSHDARENHSRRSARMGSDPAGIDSGILGDRARGVRTGSGKRLPRGAGAARRLGDVDADACLAFLGEAELARRGAGEVDDDSLSPVPARRAAIDNADVDGLSVREVRNAEPRPGGIGRMGSGQALGVRFLAARRRSARRLAPEERCEAGLRRRRRRVGGVRRE